MSFFFAKGAKAKPQYTGLSTQTSTSNLPVTILYGRNRIAPNIIWQGDFKTHKKKVKAGKGGGSQTTYTYSASFELALCWGPIGGVLKTWKDQSKETSYAALGFSLFTGTIPQSPWGYLTSKHPDEALGYPGLAYLAVANYDLGNSNTISQHSFEVKGLLEGTGANGIDADPALMIDDFLTNVSHGVGFESDVIDESTFFSSAEASTTGDGTFQTYCQAMGFALSPALSSQQKATDVVERWAMLCNTALVWTGYSLKFHPYGSDEVTGNGVTYIPDFPVRYELDDNDFLYQSGQDPLRFNRVDPQDASNSLSIVIANRDNEYNDLPVSWRDQGLVDQYGRKEEDSMDAKEVCDPDMAAIIVAFIGQRKAYVRNSFEFNLGAKYSLLEPMDILQLTDPRFGTFYVLITEINETDDSQLSIVAEEYNASVSAVVANESTPSSNTPLNTAVLPGPVNPPLIFEPPVSLSGTPQVWVAASGGDGTTFNENWGGCNVWLSLDDVTYNQIGEIDTPARQGKLTALLPTYGGVNPDTTGDLKVSLLMSNGELEDASSDAAENAATVSYVGGELLSYESVTLTGTNAYTIENLWRGQFGSTIGAHAIDQVFVRLDEAIFKYDLPEDYIGKTLYIKLQSVNTFGGGVEDLSTCVTYTYTPTGAGYGTGVGGIPAVPTGVAGSAGAIFSKLTWDAANENDSLTGVEVWRAAGSDAAFGSASKIATTSATATEYVDAAVEGGLTYTYFLVARNAVGASANTAGINLTPSTSTQPVMYGFAFQWPDPTSSKPIAFFDSPVAWAMPAGLTNSQGSIGDSPSNAAVAPSAQTDFDIQSPVGTSIGTMRFASGSLTATFIMASPVSVPLGQPVAIIAPVALNGIKGMVYGSIRGTR